MKPNAEAIVAWYMDGSGEGALPEDVVSHWESLTNQERKLPRRAIQEIKAALGYKKRGQVSNDDY